MAVLWGRWHLWWVSFFAEFRKQTRDAECCYADCWYAEGHGAALSPCSYDLLLSALPAGRHNIQLNDTQQKGFICDTRHNDIQHKWHSAKQYSIYGDIVLSVIYLLLRWKPLSCMLLCWVSLCWMSWRHQLGYNWLQTHTLCLYMCVCVCASVYVCMYVFI